MSDNESLRMVGFGRFEKTIINQHWLSGNPLRNNSDENHPILKETARQLGEYFAGQRKTFDLPLDLAGSEFQRSVWKLLQGIPFGQTISYGEQSKRLGNMKAIRAVAGANGRNPVSIIVPCHRVIGSDGSLTGFGGGLECKRWLLEHESRGTRLFG